MSISPWAIAGWALAAFLSCVILSVLALRYARWRQLLDLPGRRRSHAAPTPRGGGIAIVATLLLALPWLAWADLRVPWVFGLMLAAVAGIGWIDDHRPLTARARIAVHILAAMAGVALLLALYGNPLPSVPAILVAVLAVFCSAFSRSRAASWRFCPAFSNSSSKAARRPSISSGNAVKRASSSCACSSRCSNSLR